MCCEMPHVRRKGRTQKGGDCIGLGDAKYLEDNLNGKVIHGEERPRF